MRELDRYWYFLEKTNNIIRSSDSIFKLPLEFELTYSEDTLILIDRKYGGLLKGLRCENNCCDKQEDYFSYSNLFPNLPTNNKGYISYEIYEIGEPSLVNMITIGPKKNENQLDVKNLMEIGGRIIKLEEVKEFVEKHRLKIPEIHRGRIKTILYCDKSVDIELLNLMQENLQEMGIERIYLASKSSDEQKGINVRYQNLEELSLRIEAKTVEDIYD